MDPLTLFALANGAVSAVKQGCALYKEIQAAAGDVNSILKDLENQFHTKFSDKAPTVAEKNQYITEKNRIIELSKKQPDDIFTQVGEHLGTYFENMATCMAIFEEEEKHAFDVYTGGTSLGKRALQRVLMQTRLAAMEAELRELMVYNCPSEMGDLYNRTQKMMERIKYEQSIAISEKKKSDARKAIARAKRIDKIKRVGGFYGGILVCVFYFCWMLWACVEMRKVEYPELGTCFIPKGAPGYQSYSRLKWVDCEK
jgi:hypothetical protein